MLRQEGRPEEPGQRSHELGRRLDQRQGAATARSAGFLLHDARRGLARVLDSAVLASSHTPTSAGPDRVGRGTRLLTNAVAGPHPSCEHRGWLMGGGRHCLVSTHQLDAEEDCGAG